ncbi:MAG TPA: DUF4393 domain-containing protein [Jatrophihabitantaceae bacterium]|jgi:hypothetical protein
MTESDNQDVNLVRAVPGIARVVVTSWWHAVSWSVGATVTGGTALAKRAMNGDPAANIASDAAADLRSFAWRVLGLGEQATPERPASAESLQALGANLLHRSADVTVTEEGHPAYARILAEITPDEARILRFLYREGPQPAIDVRTNRPLGVGSELIEGGLSMIAEHAGCRHVDRIHPYLTNLNRLGLIEFSKEQVANPNRYQLVEAQPNVAAAMKRAGRSPRTVHRSIHLNEFGEEFCRVCLEPSPNGFAAGGSAQGH